MSNTDSGNIQVNKTATEIATENAVDPTNALVEIVSRLRGPGGCPWDQEQTHRTLARYATEESFEMVEALEERENARALGEKVQDPAHPLTFKFKDELADVLFQVLLHAQLTAEEKTFDFKDVVTHLSEKLVRRHPHVFSGMNVSGTEDVIKHWEVIKQKEKAARGEKAPMIAVPSQLPALQRAFAIGQKTRKLKFDWQGPAEVWLKVKEEIDELQEAMDNDVMAEIEHELGDVLFSVAQLARHYGLEPEQVLRTANNRFLGRFQTMVQVYEEGTSAHTAGSSEDVLKQFGQLSTEEKEKFWELAKKRHEKSKP